MQGSGCGSQKLPRSWWNYGCNSVINTTCAVGEPATSKELELRPCCLLCHLHPGICLPACEAAVVSSVVHFCCIVGPQVPSGALGGRVASSRGLTVEQPHSSWPPPFRFTTKQADTPRAPSANREEKTKLISEGCLSPV